MPLRIIPPNKCPNLKPANCLWESKAAGENWAQYYYLENGLDVRSIRYPGVMANQIHASVVLPITAVDIFHKRYWKKNSCFFREDTNNYPCFYGGRY